MDLADFKLIGVAFEARFPNAYKLWDEAGELWLRASRKFPDAKATKVEPNQQAFEYSKRFSVVLFLDRLAIVDYRPTAGREELHGLVAHFYGELIGTLGVASMSRIGTRLTYGKDFESVAALSEAFVGLHLAKFPSGKHLNIEGKVSLPEYSCRWEGATLGAHVQVRATDQKIEVDPPLSEPEIKRQLIERRRLLYDVDYYTLANTPVGQFQARQWMEQVSHAVSRDSVFYLGGRS